MVSLLYNDKGANSTRGYDNHRYYMYPMLEHINMLNKQSDLREK